MDGASRLVLTGDYHGLTALAEWLEGFADQYALPAQARFRLDLVLTEAITNIMDHGHLPVVEGHIELACCVQEQNIEIEIADDGPPFDPTARAPVVLPDSLAMATPGGLGIHLIRQYTSTLTYRREGARNVLRMSLPVERMPTTRPHR
jgi:anti-sigma regulatory factor (Ser/Thr protein kinase)